MRIIITGATGFIGRHLAEQLAADGHEVIATGRSEVVGAQLRECGIEFRQADLLDVEAVAASFSAADSVIHCAGKSADWGRPSEFFAVNVGGTRHVVRACEQHGIRSMVFISTPSLYVTGRDRFDISEAEPLPTRLATPYARTKRIAEQELLSHAERGLATIILRPRAVHGPRDTTLAPRILRMAERKRFPLIAGGHALTDITYIDNLVDAVRAALSAHPEAWNRVYNITNGEPIQIRDWFQRVLAAHGRPFHPRTVPLPAAYVAAVLMEAASRLPFGPKQPSITRFSVSYMATSMTLSIEAARRWLAYTPKVSNEEGLQRLADSVSHRRSAPTVA
jgi:nucleoside-diphosphate-sugar epimerase